ncbi:MAG: Photosystem I P700 chlorophyll a apoprotein A2 [Bacteroidetes bacterium ADurb.Bin408]|nr:MAG: Photosystem I P700 chlorophyll a apoprotein A2 [Bacteroidetes bacterium ADurb.Bin408]
MKKVLYILFTTLLATTCLNAQNIEFKSKNFKDNSEGLKQALESIKKGDGFLKQAEKAIEEKKENLAIFYYEQALTNYLDAQKFNPNNSELNFNLGKCYLNTWEKSKAAAHLEKAISLDEENIDADAYYLLAQSYKYLNEYDKAVESYKEYQLTLSKKQLQNTKRALKNEILDTQNAKKLFEKPVRVFVSNMEDINTPYSDYSASITADEEFMIFNSRRPDATGGKKDVDGKYFSDVYIMYKKDGKWQKPVNMGPPLNTDGHDEAVALSPDGQQMYLHKVDAGNNSNIYESKLVRDKWGDPIVMPTTINTTFNETQASFSHDGIKIYFISDQMGNPDIFFSGIMDRKRNQWGKGQRIGYDLYTPLDEGAIYYHPDGKTMYFSSKGHNSMGGYDIFKTVQGKDGIWSKPENMGYPINTPYDEKYFTITANGKYAYVTSNREGGEGEWDIYRMRFLGPEKPNMVDNEDQLLASIAQPIREIKPEPPVEVITMNLTILKGRILDDFTKKPVLADIEIYDNVKNQMVALFHSNELTGKFLVSLPSGVNYGIAVKAEGYLFHSENFDLPELSDYQLIEKDIYLKNIAIGSKVILKNIFFDSGQSKLRPESTSELTRLIELLNYAPNLCVEISGHTDNVGGEAYNIKLSEDRANAVVNYLVQKGISKARLTAKGYGPKKPIASNDNAEGRQQNRRTEFEIVKN